ncbi:peptidase [Thiorhodococcus mannitoliphagus]|uniref:Peptidase n=1 Tax=Thiorhodococcus mannitoliphagus TaxID=329406 RepID=A0A6P1DQ68_9GAMM|nr:metallopeptidase TldD-related protein [Thiorhodococcus mannitoliphagus]NEX20059.1 peptidase [Thiorhodococcus mannitoliphagus]
MNPEAFFDLAARLNGGLRGEEILFCSLGGEASDFVRLNRNAIRQAGHVRTAGLGLNLIDGARQAEAVCDFRGSPEQDLDVARSLLDRLRERLAFVPEDPYLNYSRQAGESMHQVGDGLPSTAGMVDALIQAADGLDLVGICASGDIVEGLASSLGHRYWHQSSSFNLDWSCYLGADKAVKSGYSGFAWEPEVLGAKLAEMRAALDVMARPAKVIEPGRYRAYLAPAAVQELMDMLAWGGFGLKDHRTSQTPLLKLIRGERTFASALTIQEQHDRGLTPGFTPEGFLKPGCVPLINAGAFGQALVDARSGKEYGEVVNAAADAPESLNVAAGTLSMADAHRQLDTGLSIGNLWYCNWSDMNECRITGMTRFGTFWVEGGEIVAPLDVMRFDDSLYHLLGDRLEALTRERELMLSAETYDGRSSASALLPGVLVSGIDFAL